MVYFHLLLDGLSRGGDGPRRSRRKRRPRRTCQ
jgi:hypothetical protein